MNKPESSEVAIVAGQDPVLRRASRLILPDALVLVAALRIVWQALGPGGLDQSSMNWVMLVFMGELLTFFFVGFLVEIAADWTEPPTLGVGLTVVGLLLFICPSVVALAAWTWKAGVWVFLPYLWSIGERMRQIWTLPLASPLDKLRARALAFDRCFIGVCSYFGMFLVLVVVTMVTDDFPQRAADLAVPISLALFFAIVCIDEIRVLGPGFARSPRRIWARPGRPDPWLTEGKPKRKGRRPV